MNVKRGAMAGLMGSAALALFDRWEERLLGRPAVYAPGELARGLARTLGVRLLDRAEAQWAGRFMRLGYASALALALERLPGGWFVRSALLTGAVSVGELALLPRLGATPPAAEWTLAELGLLPVHAATFAAVAQGVLCALDRSSA